MDRSVELRHLRYFVAVAEELHFGRAARRLHLEQPPLSQQIRKFEELLGYPLFTRTSREVRLTAAGEIFLERARRLLRSVEDDLEEARSVGRGEMGFLRVGFISSSMLTALPQIFGRYRQRYPMVRLQLYESFTSGVVQGLLNGSLDVGFLRDGGATEGLSTSVVFSERFVVGLPAKHRLARQKSVPLAVLRDEPFVYFPATAGLRAYERPLVLCEELGFRPRIVQEASHWLTILRLVGAGLGMTIAPACVAKIAAPDVVCRRLRGVRTMSEIELAYRQGEARSIVEGFCSVARSAFQAQRQATT